MGAQHFDSPPLLRFGWSFDGLNWTALPTPGPFSTVGLAPEVRPPIAVGETVILLHPPSPSSWCFNAHADTAK